MSLDLLTFHRPEGLQAMSPPESRGIARDGVRLLVSRGSRVDHRHFTDLPSLLDPGDLLVVNRSATLPASLPARSGLGSFRVNLSTWYGGKVWVAEPRWSRSRPGPLPLVEGEEVRLADLRATLLSGFPGIPRLVFLRVDGDVWRTMARWGEPIRYGYVGSPFPLTAYQTIFATVPGSAEMPSAGRPFSPRLVERLRQRGVGLAGVMLHAGVSSLEVDPGRPSVPVYPEPFEVPEATALEVARARSRGRRVIAVGTTVVRALESATDDRGLIPRRGFTRAFIEPKRGVHSVDGLLTGLHDPHTTHLALIESILPRPALARAYSAAVAERYLWHEFGDSHLMLRS